MIDYDFLEKVCVYKNNKLTWLKDEIHPSVYLLKIGEDIYIGSSWNLKERILSWTRNFLHAQSLSDTLRVAFDENRSFIVYILERVIIGDIRVREQFYINLLHPSLNSYKTVGSLKSDYMENKIQNGFFHLRTAQHFEDYGINPSFAAKRMGMSSYEFNKQMQRPSHDFLYKVARILDISFLGFFTKEPYYTANMPQIINGKAYKLIEKTKCGAKFDLRKEDE